MTWGESGASYTKALMRWAERRRELACAPILEATRGKVVVLARGEIDAEHAFRRILDRCFPPTAAACRAAATEEVLYRFREGDALLDLPEMAGQLATAVVADWMAMEDTPSWYTGALRIAGVPALCADPDLDFLGTLLLTNVLSFGGVSCVNVPDASWDDALTVAARLVSGAETPYVKWRQGASWVEFYGLENDKSLVVTGPVPPNAIRRWIMETPVRLIGRPFHIRQGPLDRTLVGVAWMQVDREAVTSMSCRGKRN